MNTGKKNRPLDNLSDEQFKSLADAATTKKRYTLALHGVNALNLIAVLAIAFHLATYIRSYSPPIEHRIFLGFIVFILVPLGFIKARELVHGWLFERALLRQLASGNRSHRGGR